MSAIMSTYGRLPVAFASGSGAELYDQNGHAFLDALSGIAVTNLGHCHPNVTRAIKEQAETLLHTSNLYGISQQERLATELTQLTGMKKVFFCNSGAEANETAIKVARRHGANQGIKDPKIVVIEGAFHGRTMGALSATGSAAIQEAFKPLLPGFIRIGRNDIEALENIAKNHRDVVAVHLEPIQGESGIWPLNTDFLKRARTLCDEHNWLLSFDEVQSGNGRCGALYVFQRLGVTPDVLATAKGLGNGLPIGACMTNERASELLIAGDHGTTYGGNPICCAAASAVINTLSAEQLWDQADIIRDAILNGLYGELHDETLVKDVRGCGLMIGIEPRTPTADIVRMALDRRILLNVAGGNTIRLLPPLVMNADQAKRVGENVADILNTLGNNPQSNS
ncbi:MAG: aspartate aminotransferase family protein [Luminiphilus sp.]|jgi:acetylornithine aminotransferase|uniref:Aspartate aminotransferase family protein n=1 Tax=Candidatus Paraluminiphilus aquimaris TaxID=2518994 RepID=A0ABY6Q319_9GAMM|nr:aspartate aminotransferase family protein [Candidatus Paraluminiphilus aquimaris]MCH1459206.1 aspartate aminotransferase family protein [Luminiphilus sp.]UZP73344.1 aspartate aminotransferase family protein [Candidatus Paraluminiphilus aquimaris]